MQLRREVNGDLFDGTHPEARDMRQIGTFISVLDKMSRYYFRTEVTGMDNVPDGSCLVVATHSGGLIAPDMFMLFHSWYRRFGDVKPLYGLAHDFHFHNPLAKKTLVRGGALRADKAIALKALAQKNTAVAVYPAGARELFKPFYKRDRIDFCGHRGFIKLAIEAQVPIVPTVAVGADTFLCLNEGDRTARLMGLDKLLRMPVWPWMLSLPLGLTPGPVPHLPLPFQIRISVGAPIYYNYGPEAAHDPKLVNELYNRVQGTMQAMRDRLVRVRAVQRQLLPSWAQLKQGLEWLREESRRLLALEDLSVSETLIRAAG